jgi:DNA-binding response OmpR family regulator
VTAALRLKILVLDDSEAYLAFARRAVGAAGHAFVGVSSGADLERRIADERPDAVLIDVTIPGARGFELVHVVRRHWACLPVLLMSAEPGSRLLERNALASGADGYVHKLDLADELNRALDVAAERIDAKRPRSSRGP